MSSTAPERIQIASQAYTTMSEAIFKIEKEFNVKIALPTCIDIADEVLYVSQILEYRERQKYLIDNGEVEGARPDSENM
jgi:hypothetical protein